MYAASFWGRMSDIQVRTTCMQVRCSSDLKSLAGVGSRAMHCGLFSSDSVCKCYDLNITRKSMPIGYNLPLGKAMP